METRLLSARELLYNFLEKWPYEKVKNMSLLEYVDTGNPETFCQWLETKTIELGSIKGHFSNKFGIYKRRNPKEVSETLISDAIYSWLPYYGKTRNEAFQNVKRDIIQIIETARSGNFTLIDNIHLNSLVKWKIAFLYSDERIIPIFKKDVLWKIAEFQGLTNVKKIPLNKIHSFIFDNKPEDETIYQYASRLYNKFGEEENEGLEYYIIGSKYEETYSVDMFPLMEEYNVISTGYAWKYDLNHLYLAKENDIIEELKKLNELPKSYNTLKMFLRLKPGDIIAIKSSGNPKAGKPFLEIIAYAVVVERDGEVYWYDSLKMGHCINVEFIKTGLKHQLPLGGYGRTIHNIKDISTINLIFEGFKNASSKKVRDKIKGRRRLRKAITSKNTAAGKRKGSTPYITNAKHNQIQQLFKEYLVEEYGEENVLLEENNVDIKLFHKTDIIFYEVKPYDFAEDCIRTALGQLLSYVHFDTDKRNKKIRIIGPNPADDDEKELIKFLRQNLRIDFQYEAFEIE
ncbi:MAG: hypothetical protein JWO92_1053 [Chitinophagaceae bacterium]|nr:hypothetical protein [Chitinophagaceae bacterium]